MLGRGGGGEAGPQPKPSPQCIAQHYVMWENMPPRRCGVAERAAPATTPHISCVMGAYLPCRLLFFCFCIFMFSDAETTFQKYIYLFFSFFGEISVCVSVRVSELMKDHKPCPFFAHVIILPYINIFAGMPLVQSHKSKLIEPSFTAQQRFFSSTHPHHSCECHLPRHSSTPDTPYIPSPVPRKCPVPSIKPNVMPHLTLCSFSLLPQVWWPSCTM